MIHRELPRFLIAGLTATGVDYVVYWQYLWHSGGAVFPAKTLGFLAGTCFSYLANKLWTFGHKEHRRGSVWRFLPIYTLSLGINVGVNAWMLLLLQSFSIKITLSFVVASGLSAAFNFLALKFFVFTQRRS